MTCAFPPASSTSIRTSRQPDAPRRDRRDPLRRRRRCAPAVRGLSAAQLDTPYRPGGWTIRQVVHHLGESHMNAFIRFKLALTEDNPTIKPYDEDAWAKLKDAQSPIEPSVTLLDALHQRWVVLLEGLEPADFARPLQHPERGPMTLDSMLQLYSWHGPHHVAHITGLRQREGW